MTFPTIGRRSLRQEVLIWFAAKDPSTGDPAPLGLWTGDEALSFPIDGETRPFFGAGNILEAGDIISQIGLIVQGQSVKLNSVAPEVKTLLRGRDLRQGNVTIYLARFDLETDNLLEVNRVFKGIVNGITISSGKRGGEASAELRLVSSSRILTRTLSTKKSDASQRLRGGDRFFRHADVSGSVLVVWGTDRGNAATPPPKTISIGEITGGS